MARASGEPPHPGRCITTDLARARPDTLDLAVDLAQHRRHLAELLERQRLLPVREGIVGVGVHQVMHWKWWSTMAAKMLPWPKLPRRKRPESSQTEVI